MFSLNFASKMLNTIMGTEDQPPGQPGVGGQPPHGMTPGQPQQGARPMGGGFQPVRPTPQGPGGSPRPGYGGPPTFSGPRPTPARPGPPTFGGPQRLGGPGMPHRFNGPQPPPGAQPPPGPGQRQPMPPGQQQQQPPPPQQQQPQQQPPMGMRGPSPMQNQGVSPMAMGGPMGGPMRPRGPSPLPAQQQPHPIQAKPAGAVVPDVDLSHLSAEEREMIESVMAKAQQLEQEGAGPPPQPQLNAALGPGVQPNAPRIMRPEVTLPGMDFAPRICPICRQRDMSGRDGMPGQECTECRTMVCKACGGMSPHPDTKRPEWTCGNCIKRRRMGPPTTTMGNTTGPLGQQSLGPRPAAPFGQPPQQQQPTSQNQADWDAGRRPSSAGGVPGMQITGSPQQQQQQQRWESERESDKLESMEVESWKNDVGQCRKLSSEIMPPPQLTQQRAQPQLQPSEGLYSEGPYNAGADRTIPLDLDYTSAISNTVTTTYTSTTSTYSKDPYDYLPPTTQLSPEVSNINPSFLPSTSVEGVNRPPSFAEVMRSRSQSIELEKGMITPDQIMGAVSYGSRRASADSFTGSIRQTQEQYSGSFDSNNVSQEMGHSSMMVPTSQAIAAVQQLPHQQPPPVGPALVQTRQSSSIDEKANSLMEELSKLQSAVDSTLKRRQKQQTTTQPTETQSDSHRRPRFSPPRSPSPSPTSCLSPVKDRFGFKNFGDPSSPFRSPPRLDFCSPVESPDSPEVPGVRKAIVLKEHDLDDYRDSSDEESPGSGSDDEGKGGGGGGIITSDPFYDHSPGEVYTIPEEEDEGGSPTGGDLVTSLSRPGIQSGSMTDNGSPRRRLMGQEGIMGVPGAPLDPRLAGIRPQLRPQRSLDNRLPSVSGMTQQEINNLMGGSQLDPQHQQQNLVGAAFSSNSNSQQQLGPGQMGARVDNQNLGSQMNVNTSSSMGASLPNQLGAMTTVGGGSGTMPGIMSQQQTPQQQQTHQQQLLQQQMNQQGFPTSSSVPTSSMDYQQTQNQFTMANNNPATQQQQQPHQFGGVDVTTSIGQVGTGTGDWNSNLTLAGQQQPQSSTNSVSPLIPTSADQQFGTSQQMQQQQPQPYQQINSYNQQLTPQQQQQQQPQQQLQGTTTDPITGQLTQQQQPQMQGQGLLTSLQGQQLQQQQQQHQQLQQQQQQQPQSQLLSQDPLQNQLQFQKNQMLLQQQNVQGQQAGQMGLGQTGQIQQLQQHLQTSQQQQQQPFSQMGQQHNLTQQQQLGQLQGILGGQGQQLGISTSQSSQSLQNPVGGLSLATSSSQAQQQWPQSSPSQMYDQSGRLVSTSASQFAQGQQPLQNVALNQSSQQSQQQQLMNLQNQQNQQYSQQMLQNMQQQPHLNQQSLQQQHHSQHGLGVNAGNAQVPTAKTSSIGGLLADFSRALGLGTSPRPSPSEDKSEPFPVPSSGVGAVGSSAHGQSYDPYHHQQQQHQGLGGQQQVHHGLTSGQQQVQQSAFTPIHEGSLAYLQRQQQQHQQQQSYLQQQNSQALQANLGLQSLQYGLGSSSQLLSSSAQQYPGTLLSSQAQQQHTQVLTQGGLLTQQQQNAGLGVGVVGALSPAQAHMYQQQMALQHQQQHMKKTRRSAHLSGGDMRRDGTSTVLIGGQGLAVTPGHVIGALTPAVVTSLGTFIGGASLLQQPLAVTPLGTPIGTPVGTPRSGRDAGGDSSDTMSETDSQKSLRMRRKLPCLPPDQEAAPLPSTKKRERHRSQEFRSLSPMRLSSMDGTLPGRSYPLSSLSLSRPSASESNLRKLTMGASDPIPRPGSALGCLQASSVISSVGGKQDSIYPLGGNILSSSPAFAGMNLRTTTSGLTSDLTTTTSVLSGLYPSYKQSQDSWSSNLAELAAALPPDLRHLLNKGSGGVGEHDLTGLSGLSGLTSSLGDNSLNVGSHLPSYMRTLREQLQEERRQLLSEERRRLEALRERDRELGARLDAVTSRAGSEALRSRADLSRNGGGVGGGTPRSAGASPLLNRKLKGHRRQLSDPKLSLPFSPIQEDGDSELQDFDRVTAGLLRPPYKSYEYESLEDSALLQRPATAHQLGGDWDHSQSYLASSWAAAGGALRETAITSMGGVHEDDEIRNRMTNRMLGRRSSDGEAWSSATMATRSPSSRERRHTVRKHRKSRSWHPSPYVSEEEDEEEEDSLSREEKKARIKAEIARRRQQIQERAGYHGELMTSRLPPGISEHERHSVLKSVDQLLRDQYGRYEPTSGGLYGRATPSHYIGSTPGGYASTSSSRPTHHHHHMHHHHHSPQSAAAAAHHHLARIGPGGQIVSPSASEEDRSIERIASTFRSDPHHHHHDYTNMLYHERYGEMSPLATDSESMGSELGAPAAMPLLPDMPTRSRRLLEDLGSAPILGLNEGTRGGGGNAAGQAIKARSASVERDDLDVRRMDEGGARGRGTYQGDAVLTAKPRLLPCVRNLYRQKDQQQAQQQHHAQQQAQQHQAQRHQAQQQQQQIQPMPQQRERTSLASQGDSSSPGSSRRSSRSRSLIPVGEEVEAQEGEQGSPKEQEQSEKRKSSQTSQQSHKRKYSYPVKRYWLTRDPKDRSVGGNGVGMKVVGGKELPDLGGKLVAYVAKIIPGGFVEQLEEIQDGDVIVEWAGKYLGNKTFEEVGSILRASEDKPEFEIVIRRDLNVKTGKIYMLGSTDDLRRQSDCGTEVGSNLTDSQSLGHAQQDTTDDNASDQSRPAEGTYSSSNTIASEFTSGKSSNPQSSGKTNQEDYKKSADFNSPQQQFDQPSSFLSVEESDSKIIRRHSSQAVPESGKNSRMEQPRRSLNTQQIDINKANGNSTRPSMPIVDSIPSTTRPRNIKDNGHIYLQICHDPKASILYVTVIKAKLAKSLNEDGTDHVPVDPYIVCSLYPERVIENQRRTRHVPMCSEPEFHQTMVYPQVSLKDLQVKNLEVCAWNYNPMAEDEMFGKVILPLSDQGILDEQPHSYPLRLEDTPYRKGAKVSITKSSYTSSFHTSGNAVVDIQRATDPARNGRRCPLTSAFSLKGGINKRLNIGKVSSLLKPGTSSSSTSKFPIDCHDTLCSIL